MTPFSHHRSFAAVPTRLPSSRVCVAAVQLERRARLSHPTSHGLSDHLLRLKSLTEMEGCFIRVWPLGMTNASPRSAVRLIGVRLCCVFVLLGRQPGGRCERSETPCDAFQKRWWGKWDALIYCRVLMIMQMQLKVINFAWWNRSHKLDQ